MDGWILCWHWADISACVVLHQKPFWQPVFTFSWIKLKKTENLWILLWLCYVHAGRFSAVQTVKTKQNVFDTTAALLPIITDDMLLLFIHFIYNAIKVMWHCDRSKPHSCRSRKAQETPATLTHTTKNRCTSRRQKSVPRNLLIFDILHTLDCHAVFRQSTFMHWSRVRPIVHCMHSTSTRVTGESHVWMNRLAVFVTVRPTILCDTGHF